jgi:hypothetical protein
MTRRGRGYPSAAMAGPAPRSLNHLSRFRRRRSASARKGDRLRLNHWGAGRARLDCGTPWQSLHPGPGSPGPPLSLRFCAGPVRAVGWAHASIRAKPSLGLVTFARPRGRCPNHRALRLFALRGVGDAERIDHHSQDKGRWAPLCGPLPLRRSRPPGRARRLVRDSERSAHPP